MGNHSVNLQDSFLNQVRKDGTEVEVALVNGHTHKGLVRGFDNFTVILHVAGKQHLVYKHAIAQIIAIKPSHPQPQAHPQPQQQVEPPEIEPPKSARSRRKRPAPKEPKEPREKTSQKFNALDLSHIKIKEPKREVAEAAAKSPAAQSSREKAE